MLDINEPINVWVYFKGTKILPFAFLWKERRIPVGEITLTYSAKHDGAVFHYFTIFTEGNYYKLKFDLRRLKWFIEEVEEGDSISNPEVIKIPSPLMGEG